MKTVIITGASGNLGIAVTETFLNKGYQVIATVQKEEAKKAFPAKASLHIEVVNLTNEAEAASFVDNIINQYKNIDAALLLVGGFTMGGIEQTSSNDIRKQISLNFDTAYHIARPVFQHMLQNGTGRIVFIGARPAIKAAAGKNMVAYGLSKSLLFTLAEYLNEEAKGKNVVASVVVPSTIDTLPNRTSMPDADFEDWVKPEALAEILEFAVSDKGIPLRETVLKVYGNS